MIHRTIKFWRTLSIVTIIGLFITIIVTETILLFQYGDKILQVMAAIDF